MSSQQQKPCEMETEVQVQLFAVPLTAMICDQVSFEAWCCQPCLLGRHQAALEGKDNFDWGVCCLSLLFAPYCLQVMVDQRREIRTRFSLEASDVFGTCGGSDLCTLLNWTPCALAQNHRELTAQGLTPKNVFACGSVQPGYTVVPTHEEQGEEEKV
eukprot:TRINITY_DN1983_c4_g2_i1.p1 TRINITY_DN1983_c4_g2~~TRINITY_DN1983_c4_g2_i1.p1  ORF type:complete len:177 (+),score=21.80 TRINITY_DN1983_c4_g2_i1:61-531(+)